MGMHIGLIAAKTSVDTLREEFGRAWPQFEIVETATDFDNVDAIWAWKDAQEEFVTAADWSIDHPGKSVYVFWPDGPWAMLFDETYVLASDEDGLQEMSQRLGTVLAFIVETAGGSAFFSCYRDGKLQRKISKSDTSVEAEGEPLPEEAGINVREYYMDETEALWKAFGLSPYDAMQKTAGCQAICVIDHTDYSDT